MIRTSITALFCCAFILCAQSGEEIRKQISGLRKLPDDVRARITKELALAIRRLPEPNERLNLGAALAGYATEGDFGRDTLQEVTTTLADALRDARPTNARPYVELASLVRYEHMQASLDDDPQFKAALSKLAAEDKMREHADFSLLDLNGKAWTFQNLRGKVVLLNFWATWCPPCRKEMPDLEALYREFKDQGLIVLAISDETPAKVRQYLKETGYTYPLLLDPGRTVNDKFQIDGIPKSFVYDRDGRLAAQAIDMRTRKQFLEMLRQAGLP